MKTEGWMELHEAHPGQVVRGIRWRVQPWFHSDLSHDRRVTAIRPPGKPGGCCRHVPPPQLRSDNLLRETPRSETRGGAAERGEELEANVLHSKS